MIIRTSTVLSVASLIAAFVGAPGAAGEWATKEDAIAMVQQAMVFITQHGPEKGYAANHGLHESSATYTVPNTTL
jgi:hypothetical protein